MAKLKLTLACGGYDLLCSLFDGTAVAPGIEFNALVMESPERHRRMLRHAEFDVCEMSFGGYLVARETFNGFTAIPVFPHRRFRHRYVFKGMNRGIERPADLNGKRIGLRTLRNTAGLWMRGILQDHYGVDLNSIEWWCQDDEEVSVGAATSMQVRRVPPGKNIDRMLVDGELEAAMYPDTLPSIRSGLPQVALLFADPKQAEIEYYRKSGIFPIMHTIVIKNEILVQHPWVAVSVLQGFQQAKELCYRHMRNPRNLALVWAQEVTQEQESVFGKDPWPYNLPDNRKALEALLRYASEQGMIKTKPRIEELFVPSSLEETLRYL